MHATLLSTGARPRVFRWRVVDIVVASVVAVASGVVFWVWGVVQNPISGPVAAVLPGFQGILNGPWLFAGVLVALIVFGYTRAVRRDAVRAVPGRTTT